MIKKYVIFKKEFGYIISYFYSGTNIRKISKLLDVPYRNIYRYDYLKDLQRWQFLNSNCPEYIIFDENNNRILRLVNKETGNIKTLYFFSELYEMMVDYERSLKK